MQFNRDLFKIVGFDSVLQVIDESMSQINVILSSRYVKRYQREAEDFNLSINLIFDCFELWKECQRSWLYLENIF